MSLIMTLVARFLEAMFVIGIIGSLGVLLVSFVEDFETLVDREDSSHPE